MNEYSTVKQLKVSLYQGTDKQWDSYVFNRNDATFFHQMGYKKVIEESFGHKSYYLAALEDQEIVGILPLFLIRSRLFGSYLVSLPFCDYAGFLADSELVEKVLISKGIEIGQKIGVQFIELRQKTQTRLDLIENLEKVNSRLIIDDSEEKIWDGLKTETRRAIKKARSMGLQVESGGLENLSRFFNVYATNMRDLGTPAYTSSFFEHLLEKFPDHTEIILVIYRGKTIGGAVIIYFKDGAEIFWASSLRSYFCYRPNNLLFWEAIVKACRRKLKYIDFGRSSKDSGTYTFKKRWRAEDEQLYYYYVLLRSGKIPNLRPSNPKYKLAIKIWKGTPLFITNLIGPYISKYLP